MDWTYLHANNRQNNTINHNWLRVVKNIIYFIKYISIYKNGAWNYVRFARSQKPLNRFGHIEF